ncbi:MAG: toll/interleukin-1 receptor domain-containing protein [Phycisphaerales bacterium]
MSRSRASSSRSAAPEVFLSHSSKDRAIARRVRGLLERHGVRVWYSEHTVTGAADWHREIGKALARCNWFVLLLSKSAAKSVWVNREYVYALNSPRYKDRIVPVVVAAYDERMIWAITGVQRIDLRKQRGKDTQSLLGVWGKTYDGRGFAARASKGVGAAQVRKK